MSCTSFKNIKNLKFRKWVVELIIHKEKIFYVAIHDTLKYLRKYDEIGVE